MKLHRFGSFLAIALALALANVPIAQARHHYGRSPNAAQTRPDAGAETYAYVFHDAEITQVIDEVLGRGLKLTYRLDPGVTGKMSFSIEQRLTKAQLLAALEAALTQYDVVMLKQGDTLILKPRATAQIGAGVSQGRGPSAKLGYQVRAIPVHFASASEVAKAITGISRDKMVLFSSDNLGLILLGGSGEDIDNAIKSIELFDQDTLSEARIRFFELSSADPQTVATDLGKILTESGTSSVHVAPMKRLNGLFAFARTTQALDRLTPLVARLDIPSRNLDVKVLVYRPHGGSAETLAHTLNQVLGLADTASQSGSSGSSLQSGFQLGGGSNAGTSGSGTSNNLNTGSTSSQLSQTTGSQTASATQTDENAPRIIADRDSNTLIIAAPESMRVKAMAILNEIDHEPTQVFIEASILEVTLTNDLSYGVDWTAFKGAGKISNFTGTSTGFATPAPGFSINYLKGDIKAAISALSSKSEVKVMSAPKITTRENIPAQLQVGDQVPIITQTQQATTSAAATLINSVTYRDTGILLRVTPRVLADNRVELDVAQEVSTVSKTKTSGIDSPTISQRRLESSLIVPEGTVVALGGLISTNETKSETGAPGVSRIPVIGNLFKSQAKTSARTELIILIETKVLRDQTSYRNAMDDLTRDLTELNARGMLMAAWPKKH